MSKATCYKCDKPNIVLVEVQGYYDGASFVQCQEPECKAIKCRFTDQPVESYEQGIKLKLGRPSSVRTDNHS